VLGLDIDPQASLALEAVRNEDPGPG
jgi:hypothetical protein